MARCRHCNKTRLMLRKPYGVCKPCSEWIQQDVERHMVRIKNALLYVRCSKDPETQLSECATALECAEELLVYEKKQLCELNPKPSSVVEMLRARRAEIQAELGAVDVPGANEVHSEPSAVSSLPTGEGVPGSGAGARQDSPGNGYPARPEGAPGESSAADEWWAWKARDAGGNPEDAGNRREHQRGRDRIPVNCYALLNPGGVRGQLENLSSGGLFLRAGQIKPPGSLVRVIISTEHGPAIAEGTVRWTRAASERGNVSEPEGMGIEFSEVSPELSFFLSSHLGIESPAGGSETQRLAV